MKISVFNSKGVVSSVPSFLIDYSHHSYCKNKNKIL